MALPSVVNTFKSCWDYVSGTFCIELGPDPYGIHTNVTSPDCGTPSPMTTGALSLGHALGERTGKRATAVDSRTGVLRARCKKKTIAASEPAMQHHAGYAWGRHAYPRRGVRLPVQAPDC